MKHLVGLFSLLPLWAMYALSSVLWAPLYYLGRYRRKVVRRNLTESFPELGMEEIKRIERRFYRRFLDTVFEMLKMATMSEAAMRRRMVFVNAGDVAGVLERGISVSLFLGHYANWEWVSSLPLHLPAGVEAGQVYHKLHDRGMDKMLIRNRERMGAVCVEMNEVARWLARRRDKVTIVGYIADQSPQRQFIRHWVPFLNHRTPAYVGAEILTARQGAQAWYLDVRRVRRGRYEAEFVKLDVDGAGGEYPVTDLYYRYLERAVRRAPELYLWTHNRFKHAERD